MKPGQRKNLQEIVPGEPERIPPNRLPKFRSRVNLAFVAKRVGGKAAMIDHARLCGREEIRQIVEIWDSRTKSRQQATHLEELCELVDISEGDFLAEVVKVLYEANADVSKLLVAIHQPAMIESLVKFGKKEKNFKDREAFLKGSGFIPVPVSQFGFMLNNNIPAAQQAPAEQVPDANLTTLEQENQQHQPFERS